MKLAIANAFENDGFFKMIRGEERQAIAEAESLERVNAESSLVLPFTFGDLRRHLNIHSLNEVQDQNEQDQDDEEIGVEDASDSDSDDDDE
jgi:hypothetical protein